MSNFIFAEVSNKLHKLGLKKTASVGALVEGKLGPFNTTIITSLGKNIRISRNGETIEFVDPIIKSAVDKYVLDYEGNLKYKSLKDFVDATTNRNTGGRKKGLLDSLQNQSSIGFVLSVITGDDSFLTKPFADISNCIEYSSFISVVSRIYYPKTEVRLVMFSGIRESVNNIFEGIVTELFNRHTYFVFKDIDQQVYISIFGQKVRPLSEALDILEKRYNRDPQKHAYIPKLIKNLINESNRLR